MVGACMRHLCECVCVCACVCVCGCVLYGNNVLWQILSLPIQEGGLGLSEPSKVADYNYCIVSNYSPGIYFFQATFYPSY